MTKINLKEKTGRKVRMNIDKETKKKMKDYFSSKKFIIAAAIFLLAAGTGIGTAMSVSRQLRDSLSGADTSYNETTKENFTEDAAENVTGVTVPVTEKATEEEVSVIKEEDFVLPSGKKILKDYSNSVAVKSKTMNDWRVHNGVDFKAEEGDEVKAVQSGAVLAVYNSSLWGTIVEIDHGAGIVARYCGLAESLKIGVNDVVEQEQVIGYIGKLPVEAADGAHLHFEILKDGAIADPLSIFE